MLNPPNGAAKLPSRLDPPENGTTSGGNVVSIHVDNGSRNKYRVGWVWGGCTHRNPISVAYLDDLRYFGRAPRINNSDGKTFDVRGRPCRVPMMQQNLVVGTNRIVAQ